MSPIDVVMPQLSDTMTEGVLLRWCKQPGDAVSKGDVMAEVETDKATMEVQAWESGTLDALLIPEGATLPVGAPIARLLKPGEPRGEQAPFEKEAPQALVQPGGAPMAPTPVVSGAPLPPQHAAGRPARIEENGQTMVPLARQETPQTRAFREGAILPSVDVGRQPSPAGLEPAIQGLKISPKAQAEAERLGVDLSRLQGSGPGGRILERDVLAAAGPRAAASTPPPVQAPESPPATPTRLMPPEAMAEGLAPASAGALPEAPPAGNGLRAALRAEIAPAVPGMEPRPEAPAAESAPAEGMQTPSPMRRLIAERMTHSKEAPHFYVTLSVRMDELVRLRDRLAQEDWRLPPASGSPAGVSVNDFVMKATALALRQHPRLNALDAFDPSTPGAIRPQREVNLAMAVALPDGLVTPVIRNADLLPISALSEQADDLIARAHAQQLTPEDLKDATFTVSNMGMLKVDEFIAIINPPQAAILAVGALKQVPVVEEEAIVPAYQMTLTLSANHRVVNGVEAAEFLRTVAGYLADPMLMLL